MPLLAFLLVIASAILHALWNFTVKVSGNLSVLCIGLWVACIACLPFVLISPAPYTAIRSAYPFVLGSGIIHGIYFFSLYKAYQHTDISIIYPIARGTGVAGTGLAAYLLLKEDISFMGGAGILLVCIGIVLVGFQNSLKQKYLKGLGFALFVGFMIVNYSIIDKQAVEMIDPVTYIFGVWLLSAVFLTPCILIKDRRELLWAWRKFKRNSIVIGVGSMGTYLVILFAYQLSHVSYVVATREIAVVIGAVLGFKFLNEKYTLKKIIGILTIVLGLIMIKGA
jgi:drug/metabolite transporter (DMT)-like permease